MVEYTYIVDFASVLFIYLGVRNTGEAGEKLLHKRVERVVSRLFCNHALALKRRKSFTVARSGASTVFGENQLSYSGFIGSRKAHLKSILLHFFVVPAETPHQHRSF